MRGSSYGNLPNLTPFLDSREFGDQAAFVPGIVLPDASTQPLPGFGGLTPSNSQNLPGRSVTEPQRYGYVATGNGALLANTDTTVLLQPDSQRTFLVVQNTDAALDVWVNFGAAAAVNRGIKLTSGGILLMDAFVSQDDVHLFSTGAALFGISYSNTPFPG